MKITDEAVEAAARKRAEHYESEYDSRHLKWQDFIWEAREILDAALPHLDDDGAAAPPEAVHSAPLAGAGARDAVTPTAAPSSLPHLEGATPAIDREQIAKALFDYDNRNPLIPRDWSRAMKLERAACLGRADAVLALIGGAS